VTGLYLAEREGFEPPLRSPPNLISSRTYIGFYGLSWTFIIPKISVINRNGMWLKSMKSPKIRYRRDTSLA
jgi:hypothetical protein